MKLAFAAIRIFTFFSLVTLVPTSQRTALYWTRMYAVNAKNMERKSNWKIAHVFFPLHTNIRLANARTNPGYNAQTHTHSQAFVSTTVKNLNYSSRCHHSLTCTEPSLGVNSHDKLQPEGQKCERRGVGLGRRMHMYEQQTGMAFARKYIKRHREYIPEEEEKNRMKCESDKMS